MTPSDYQGFGVELGQQKNSSNDLPYLSFFLGILKVFNHPDNASHCHEHCVKTTSDWLLPCQHGQLSDCESTGFVELGLVDPEKNGLTSCEKTQLIPSDCLFQHVSVFRFRKE
jgi:hypothetical protein